MEEVNQTELVDKKLEVSPEAEIYLKETSNWGMFFSILGFVFIGIMMIASIFVTFVFSFINDPSMPPFTGVTFGLAYFTMAIVYLFPVIYLFRFSDKVKTAIIKKDQVQLNVGLKNLKSHYKFMGIMTIIIFSLYILVAVVMLSTGAVSEFWT